MKIIKTCDGYLTIANPTFCDSWNKSSQNMGFSTILKPLQSLSFATIIFGTSKFQRLRKTVAYPFLTGCSETIYETVIKAKTTVTKPLFFFCSSTLSFGSLVTMILEVHGIDPFNNELVKAKPFSEEIVMRIGYVNMNGYWATKDSNV